MKHRRILSGLAALMLAASLPMSALAREWDIADGDITIVTVSIVAEKDQTANVTLGGANIDVSDKGKAAISTSGEGDVTIDLDGNNEIMSGRNHAGLEKRNEGNLEITDKDQNGALTANGGGLGAGIGGGDGISVSDITVSGGNIKATGGVRGAGIGGGQEGDGSNITISGGNIVATGGDYAAGEADVSEILN